jgi:hypothetical protein
MNNKLVIHFTHKILAIGFALGTAAGSAAQISDSVETPSPRLGVQVGAAFNNVSTPNDINTSNRTGFAAGARMAFPLSPYLSLQPEATFVQRGATFAQAGGYSVTAKYNTLQVPVLLKATLPTQPVSPYLTAGPVAFFNLSSSLDANTPGGSAASVGLNPRTVEFGASIGAGVDIGPVFVAANYLIGLTELDENSTQYHSRGVQLMGGVQF